jgi:hypothetical protein
MDLMEHNHYLTLTKKLRTFDNLNIDFTKKNQKYI